MSGVAAEPRPGLVAADAVMALLVDADRAFVQFAREELNQSAGAAVCLLHAPTLAQASAILAETPVAVILLSRVLPDGDALCWLAAARPTLEAGVLLLVDERPELTLQVHAEDVLVKAHLKGDTLAEAIRRSAEQERSRRQLLRTREDFQSLIEHARDLITVVDDAGRIVYQSPAAVALLGTPPHAHHGQVFAEFVHPEDAGRARSMLDEVLTGDGTGRGEFRLPHADGSLRTFEVIASRLERGGDPFRVVLNGRDVTERRRAEEALKVREAQLVQAQKMEAVGRLAGGIAHDFSNVLTVIAGACERLQDQIAQGAARTDQVEVIIRHCARATALTRQLLAFSRQQTIAPRIVDLGALVRRAGELVVQLVGAQVHVETHIDDGLLPIEADPVQMEQVLMNLAINARDAMPGGGVLRVVVRNVDITPALAAMQPPMPAGRYVRLEVSDSGHGMGPEVLARAFEPFFTTKDPTRGTGLGLATVYGIITQSRGHVRIESAPGRGARFIIHLPVREERALEAPPPEGAGSPRVAADSTILIAEDDADLRDMLCETLGARGYRVIDASGPSEALAAAVESGDPIDLLLTDLVMPGGTGRDLARRMSGTTPGLKVLYMSGYGEPDPGVDGLLEPGDPFLPKPFTRQQLLDAIERLIG